MPGNDKQDVEQPSDNDLQDSQLLVPDKELEESARAAYASQQGPSLPAPKPRETGDEHEDAGAEHDEDTLGLEGQKRTASGNSLTDGSKASSSSLGFLSKSKPDDEKSQEFWKSMKAIGNTFIGPNVYCMSIACLLLVSAGKLLVISKNTHQKVDSIVDYMSKQDARLQTLEDSHKSMMAHFVREKQEKTSKFPFNEADELLAYAEKGEFDDLIAV